LFRSRFHTILLLALAVPQLAGQSAPKQSTITIHVHKAGVFSPFGHNHTVVAPVHQVTIDAKGMAAEIVVLSRQMKVTDTDVSEKDRGQIQADMLGPKVLNAEKFPEIRFKSTRIETAGAGHLRVTGTLDLHGVRKEITLEMTGGGEHYQGKTRLKQTDFAMQPISVAGGTVKVKDQLDLEFDIYAESVRNGNGR
jgi:polyisoprenoid-binding protein YceI